MLCYVDLPDELSFVDSPDELRLKSLKLKLTSSLLLEVDEKNVVGLTYGGNYNILLDIKNTKNEIVKRMQLSEIVKELHPFKIAFNISRSGKTLYIVRVGKYCDWWHSKLMEMDDTYYQVDSFGNICFRDEVIEEALDYRIAVSLSSNCLNMIVCQAFKDKVELRLYKSGVLVKSVAMPSPDPDDTVGYLNDIGVATFLNSQKVALDLLKEMNEV